MRAIIDTNVLMAGLLWRGPSHALLEHVRAGAVSMVSSLAEVRQLAEVIEPPPLPAPVCRDPDDDEVLALAIAAKVDLIVSGDNDLLALGGFEGIPIMAPAQAISLIEETGKT